MAKNSDVESLRDFAETLGLKQSDETKKPVLKISDDLAKLWINHDNYVSSHGSDAGYRSQDLMLTILEDTVTVDVAASGSASSLLRSLNELGLEDGTAFGKMVSGRLPIEHIDEMAKLSGVETARAAYGEVQAGSVLSQGDVAIRAATARAQFDVTGEGVTIGVMSDSFDTGPGSYATDVATGDLPAGVAVLSDWPAGTDEGRAMAQLAYDIAPGSTIAFHTAKGGQADFAQGIIDLMDAGADIITDDVLYPHEPMFMDGIVAKAIDTVKAAGVSYFSSAGNAGVQSYETPYREVSITDYDLPFPFYQSLHDFNPGIFTDRGQDFTLAPGASIALALQWADPFISHSPRGAQTDLDAFIYDTAGVLLTSSIDNNVGVDPYELIEFRNNTGSTQTYELVIANYEGPNPTHVKYVDFGDAVFTEHTTNSGASFGHASAEGAESVGAARYNDTPAFGTAPPQLRAFSSVGGTPILFDGAGNRLAAPVFRDRVDIVAPDGTDTTFIGFDTDGNGRPNFSGTSAAAPHAAGAAALLLDAKGNLTPAQVYDALESKAIDMDNPYVAGFQTGKDIASGYGLVDVYASIQSVLAGGPTQGDDVLNGTDGPDDIFALGGNDSVFGKGGDDYLDGGPGIDAVYGDAGADVIVGADGDDYLDGGLAVDVLYGDAGIDKVFGQDGADLMYGGIGNDELGGQAGNDTMYGEAGIDQLGGGGGNDLLYGGTEVDTLIGRDSQDRLYGQAGNDKFDYDAVADSLPGATLRDIIYDFAGIGGTTRTEYIDLATIDANTGLGGNQAFAFRGTAAFTGAGQLRVIASGTDTLIQANTGGTTAPELEILVKDGTALPGQWAAGDFVL